MLSIRSLTCAGCAVLLASCKAIATQSEGGAPSDIELPTRGASPTNPSADFHVDDEVAVLKDDGTLDVSGVVEAAGGKLAFVAPATGGNLRTATTGWIPAEEVRGATQSIERTAERSYKVRTGSGRTSASRWFPSMQVFPAPWPALASIKVGDVLYERRFGSFESPRCVVTAVPTARYQSVSVLRGDSKTPSNIQRSDLLPAFVHRSASELREGEIVYYNRMYWAMVVGKSPPRVIIRETGFAAKDKIVDVSRIESVH